jgi:aldose 1-epimerase
VGLTVGYRAHMQGNFHKLKEKVASEEQEAPVPKPGGQEAITLMRTRGGGEAMPEFLSITALPGRGMNVLQISAYIPNVGEVNLMASPSIESAAASMTGKDQDSNGQASQNLGSPFEVPWADLGGTYSPGADHTSAVWRGHTLTLPDSGSGGLMLAEPAGTAGTTALPEGGQAQAVFNAGDFGGHWPSNTEVTVTALLTSRTIELTVLARNTGDVAEPIGIGWRPRFAILNQNRGQLHLRIPGEKRVETHANGMPTGTLLPVANTPYDFTKQGGAKLGTANLDECFAELRQGLLDNGPVAELSDPESGYGIRMTALSSTIKAIRVVAPADGGFVSVAPQYNYPDALGREWPKDTDTGIVVLQPGQSTQWKVRLELFSAGTGAKL